MSAIDRIFLAFLEGLKPIKVQTVTDWANENQFLSSVSSAEPGKYNSRRTPYAEEIMDKLSPTDPCQEVFVQKSVQLGLTTVGMNVVGTYIDISPCSILYVLPTIEMAKGFSKERIDPMVANCPRLSDKIKSNRERDSGNNILTKSFPGGVLVLGGSNSGSGLRSRPIRLLILDETDAYPMSVDNEGSPIELARKRTVTFSNKKIYTLSTPTVSGSSVIEKGIEGTDKRKYFVPLPCCGTFQVLEFVNLVWEGNDPKEVKYKCPHCGTLIEERMKPRFLGEGKWIATDPEKSSPLKYGYIINGLYSPLGWMSWLEIVQEYLKSKDDPLMYQTFINTVLGEPWKEQGEAPPWEQVYNRRETYKMNRPGNEVAFITAGVDVQKDRLELELVGWGRGKESWSLDYRVLLGDTTGADVWSKLTEILQEDFQKPNGQTLQVRLMAVDSGYNTTHVYDWVRKSASNRVVAIKGSDSQANILVPPRTVDTTRGGKKIGSLKVWHVGVSILKQEIYGLLMMQKNEDGTYPPGYCHFPEYDQHYFKGLTAEQLQFKIVRGFKKYEWVKKFERNEPLDCRNYARAAASIYGMDRLTEEGWDMLLGMSSGVNKRGERKRDSGDSFWG